MAIGISVSRIVIIESLQPREPQTGAIQAEWIRALVANNNVGIGVDLVVIPGAAEFRIKIHELVAAARTSGDWPILHIECHGSRATGLSFADRTVIPWEELGRLFAELNVATEFNLLVLVAACFGAYLTAQFSPINQAPAWGIIAPTHEVGTHEILSGFRSFYENFAKTKDLGTAVSQLSRSRLSEGEWYSKLAEDWYVQLIIAYTRKHCTHDATRHWARTLSHKMRAAGNPATVRSLERDLAIRNGTDLTGKYFDRFFSLTELPSNVGRFAPVRMRVHEQICNLRASGRFAL